MNKNTLIFMFSVVGVICLSPVIDSMATDFKPLSVHATTLYNLVDDYINVHSTEDAHNVYLYVNSDATKPVFADARKSGYERSVVVFSTYQLAFTSSPRKDVLIDGFHELVVGESVLKDAAFYGSFVTMGWTFCSLIYTIRATYRYLKKHNPFSRV